MKHILTSRQSEIRDFISEHISHQSIPPTIAEIRAAFGLASNTGVVDHLKALEQKGHIRYHKGRARGIELLQGLKESLGLPIIGRVAAGSPVEAIENTEKVIHVPAAMFRYKPDYLLRVRGDSMVKAGILDNDLIAVRKQSIAKPGQIVVARHDDEVTVKELQIDNGEVVLLPANDAYSPIRIPADMVTIEGIYVGLVRESAA